MSTLERSLATGTSATRLRMALTRLVRTVRRHSGATLTPSQISAMATFEELGAMRISTLALVESMGAPAATRVVASLKELGLVERTSDPVDKRASVVELSARGRVVLAALWAERTLELSARLDRLSAKERALIDAAMPVIEKLARDS